MTRRARIGLVLGLAGAAGVAAALLPPMAQDPAYHRMADARALGDLPNAANVLSSLAFVLVGALGLGALGRRPGGARAFVLHPRERWPYGLFFLALALTGLGSAYYHLAPDNGRLVWDRLPLAVAVVSLLAATVVERIGARPGLAFLGPLVAAAVWSVLHWHAGEGRGQGDLRWYALVQFFPVLAIPLMLLLFPSPYTGGGALLAVAALYAAAKGFEALDAPIFAAGGIVSGHTLKHLAAAAAGSLILRMLLTRHPIPGTRDWGSAGAMSGPPQW